MSKQRFDKDLEKDIVDGFIDNILVEYGKEIRQERDIFYKDFDESEYKKPSEESLLKIEKALKKESFKEKISDFFKSLYKPLKYVSVSLVAIILVFTISVVSVDAVRFKFLEWLSNIKSDHMTVNVIDENTNPDDVDVIYSQYPFPNYLPSEYVLKSALNENNIITLIFSNKKYDITIFIYLKDEAINLDNENLDNYQEVEIGNYNGYYIFKNNTSVLSWYTENNSYTLITNDISLSIDELIATAQSVPSYNQ